MMWEEFEELAGYKVSCDDYYNVIEPMYMGTNLSKQDFVKCLDEKRFSLDYAKKQMLKEMKKIAKFLYENCGRASHYDELAKLEKLGTEYAAKFVFTNTGWDSKHHWLYWDEGYELESIQRGCRYPRAITIMKDEHEVETIELVKVKAA